MKIRSLIPYAASLAILTALSSCISDTQTDQYLTWSLDPSLKEYHLVNIRLHDATDTGTMLEEVHNDTLPDPEHFPRHKLKAAKGRHFVVRITCFDAKNNVVYAKHIEVQGNTPKAPVSVVQDLRLLKLATTLDLTPAFAPEQPEYRAQTPEATTSFTVTATPMDASNALTINGQAVAWGATSTQTLDTGTSTFELEIKGKTGPGRAYRLFVTRGNAVVENFKPVLSVGENTTARKGEEVVFPIDVTVKNATIVCFKYDLEGDGKWDNTDTTTIPKTLKHVYAADSDYTAQFLARSSTGLQDTATRSVKVSSAKYLIAITSPGRDTIVNKPIPVTYTVNNTSFTKSPTLVEGKNVVPIDTGTGTEAAHASREIFLDQTKPSQPEFTLQPATPRNLKDNPPWAWKAGNDGTGSGLSGDYRYSVDGGKNWKLTTAISMNSIYLIDGLNTLHLQELDKAGNWSESAISTVVVDRIAPLLKTTTPTKGFKSKVDHLIMAGSISDNGTDPVTITISGMKSGSPAATIQGTTWSTQTLILNNGNGTLLVTAKDLAGNITRDTIPYTYESPAPLVQIASPPKGFITNKDTVTVLYTVDNGPAQYQRFDLSKDGDIDLIVQSPVNGTNPRGSATVTVTRDTYAPQVKIITPNAAGDVTNKSAISIIYDQSDTPEGATPVWVRKTASFPLPKTGDTANAVTVTSLADGAGNIGKTVLQVWRRPNVIFVSLDGSGAFDGSSWHDPRPGRDSLAIIIGTAAAGSEIWITRGIYNSPDSLGFALKPGVGIHGGFAASGRDLSKGDRNRNLEFHNYPTLLQNVKGTYLLQGKFAASATPPQLSISGLDLNMVANNVGILATQSSLTMESIRFKSNANSREGIVTVNADLSITKCLFEGFNTKSSVILSGGKKFLMNECQFKTNVIQPTVSMGAQIVFGAPEVSITNSKFEDAIPAGKNLFLSGLGTADVTISLTGNTFKAANIGEVLKSTNEKVTQSGNTFTP